MLNKKLREEIIAAGISSNHSGLNPGNSGNVSARSEGGFLITPSAIPYNELTCEDIVELAANGQPLPGQAHAASSEWRFHQAIYAARPDIQAILHTHATACTVLACLRRDIPPFHYMVAFLGGKNVRCAEYATFGTDALSTHILAAMEGRKGCLMANHGMIVGGHSVQNALYLAGELETLAEQYCRVLQLDGPIILDDAEMDRVIERFRTGYGQRQPAATE